MDAYRLAYHTHDGFAYLYVAALFVSLVLALPISAGNTSKALLKAARVAMVLTAIGFGTTMLVGFVVWAFSGLGVGTVWLWGCVVWAVLIAVLNGRFVRPVFERIRAGEPGLSKRYAALVGLHGLLGFGLYGTMHVFSRL